MEVPQQGPGAESWWGSGVKPREAEDMLITIAIGVNQKPLIFSAWEFPGRACPPCPPFPTPLGARSKFAAIAAIAASCLH